MVKCSALKGEGMAAVWDKVQAFRKATAKTGEFDSRRRDQAKNWLWQEVSDGLLERLKSDPDLADRLAKLETKVASARLRPRPPRGRCFPAFSRAWATSGRSAAAESP